MSTRYDQDTGEYSLFVNGKFVPVAVRYSDKLPPDATPFYPRKPFSEAMHAAVVAEVAKFSKLALESKLVQGHLCWLVSRTDRQHDYDYTLAMEDGLLASDYNQGGIEGVHFKIYSECKKLNDKADA